MQMRAFVNSSYKAAPRSGGPAAGKGAAPRREGRPATPALRGADSPEGGKAPEGGGALRARARRGAQSPRESERAPQGPQGRKRPARARRPGLPRAGPAVLSAMAGLTAGFGMGPGDPRLRGRARAGRSPRGPGCGRPGVLRPACARLDSSRAILSRLDVSEELGLLVPLA